MTKELLDISPAFAGFIDCRTAQVIHFNDLALSSINSSLSDVVGKVFWDCDWWKNLPKSAAMVREAFVDAQNNLCSSIEVPYWTVRNASEGEVRWIALRMVATKSEDSHPKKIAVSGVDITDYKLTELRLKESEERLSMALSAGNIGFWILDIKKGLIVPDEAMARDWGIEANESFSLIDMFMLIHSDDLRKVKDALQAAMTTTIFEVEHRVIWPNGKVVWIHLKGRAQLDEEGKAKSFNGVSMNTTAQKKAEARYRLEKDKLESVFTESPAAMAIWRGEDLMFEKVNGEYQKIYEGRPLLGRTLEDAIPELKDQSFPEILRNVFRTGEPYVGVEAPALIRLGCDGPLVERYYDFTYVRINDGEGRPYGVYDHAIDVTERVRSRKALENSALLLGTVLDSIPAPICVFDINERFQLVNRHVLDTLKIPADDLIGKTIRELVGDEPYEKHRNFIRKALEGTPSRAVINLNFGEKDFSYEISYSPGFGANGKVDKVVAMAWDRTAEAELAEVMRKARDAAESASASKSAFLANMSHEIRTPLGAIMGFSDLASQVGTSKKDLDSYLSIINRSSEQVLRIIDDILDLSKVEAGKMNIEKVNMNLTEFLADFSSLMGFRAKENGISFTTSAQTDLPVRVITDPTRLRQILTNSVGNAIKFTGQGEVKLHVSFVDGKLNFLVSDTGRGISPEQAEILFQPFSQADSSTTRKFGGTGLGLVVTRGLCSIMGGDYSLVKSQLGEGSHFLATVKVELPEEVQMISAKEVAFEALIPHPAPLSLHQLKNLRILLVEDSPDNQRLLKILLTQQGAEMEMANDGLEGMEKALQDCFDIVLMDIQMPRMDGHGAARRLRSKGYKKPIIALTAHAMKEEAEKAARSGFSGYITKPIQKQELIQTILAAGRP